MPAHIRKHFTINSESRASKGVFNNMLKRFSNKTQTFEFLIKFNNNVEKTDESSITLAVENLVSGDIID